MAATVIVAQFAGAQAPGNESAQNSETGFYSPVDMDCMAVKVKLSKIHEDDSLMRVTVGQAYGMISDKLMSRLHAKIVEQRLDGSELVKKAADFEIELDDFRKHYQEYEVALNDLLKMDCGDQQQLYYSTLQEVRTKRNRVYEDTQHLERHIHEYKELFVDFKKGYTEEEYEK